MSFAYADDTRNLLHLIYVGTLDRAEAKALLEAARKVLPSLRRGFDILSDLRDLKVIEREAVEVVDELMELCNQHGSGRVVRVLPNATENFGFPIMSIFHYDRDVRFVTCLDLEEATKHLLGGSHQSPSP